MKYSAPFCLFALIFFLTVQVALGQFVADPQASEGETVESDVKFGKQVTVRYEIGVEVEASNGPCRDIFATMAVPKEWPEQSVRIVDQNLSAEVASVEYRDTSDDVRQMIIKIPVLQNDRKARAVVTFEVTRKEILPPSETDKFEIPRRTDRAMQIYLNPSPYIESRDSMIRRVARQATTEPELAWTKVESIYDYVRENVKYVNGPLKGARAALRDGDGDCEELSSLFIAMCRANNIPARTVWIPGHCYPEFYLIDENGEGTWFPCQAAGDRAFGSMNEARPILQKGDSFSVPEKPRERIRYVADYLRGLPVPGGGQPKIVWVRDLLN